MYGWNVALGIGFGGWMTCQILVGVAYVIYVSCLSEMASAVQFAGGSYGTLKMISSIDYGSLGR